MTDWISPTSDETEYVRRAALVAAYDALDYDFAQDREDSVTRGRAVVLRAFKAARDIVAAANTEFEGRNIGNNCHSHHVDLSHVVASALWTRNFAGAELDIDKTVPYCAGAMHLMAYASAWTALFAHSMVESAHEEEGWGVEYVDAALALEMKLEPD